MDLVEAAGRPWRVDRKSPRTIYATHEGGGSNAGAEDIMIGVMDSEEIAQNAVEAHNLLLIRTDLAETAADLEEKAALFGHVVERLEAADGFIDWILAMDDPLDAAGRSRRQRFTLAWLFDEARVIKATRSDQATLR